MSQLQIQLKEAILFYQMGQLEKAKESCERLLLTESTHAETLHLLGIIEYQMNNSQRAVALLSEAIKHNPTNPVLYSDCGNALQSLNKMEAALQHYDHAIRIKPDFTDVFVNRGLALQALNQLQAAVENYGCAINLKPDFADAHFNRANALYALQKLRAAVESYDHAIRVKPDYAEAYFNRGRALRDLMELEESLKSYECAINIKPNYADAYFNCGNVLLELKQLEAAVQHYDNAIAINPNFAEAYVNRGNVLLKLMQFERAIESYNSAIIIQSDFAEAYVNRGNAFSKLMQFEMALDSFNHAINIKPDLADAYVGRGHVLQELKQLENAVINYEKAITINPDFEYLLGTLLHAKMNLCDWADFKKNTAELVKRIECNEKASSGFPIVAITTSALIQRKTCEIWANDKYPFDSSLGDIPKHSKSNKIRIGYFSADFRDHAVSILLAELFELHNKNRFELIAFSFGPDVKDAMRERIETAFDRFIDVRNLSDKEIAFLARQMKIDIAIDLGGATAHARTGIFSYRAAPIQVNYLGYSGTMDADYFDYIIADRIIIPAESQQYYAEKIIYLPNCYQSNDSKRVISDKAFTKKELGLPADKFVFCCFNNNYKITPDVFDGWMRILKIVTGSVLFLYADNKNVEQNLQKEAVNRGVDPNRLIFGERLLPPDYLARYKWADLFLDTFPNNACTTASDALWAGLPVLTLIGDTFVSRVAASLLNAIGLSELITQSQEDYEALAIDLATHPTKLQALKVKLAANRLTTPLFNTPLFTKHIESAYTQMMERYYADLQPDHIFVANEFSK